MLTVLLTGGVGLILFAGSPWADRLFAWQTASPLTAALLGAGFLGVSPMFIVAG